MTKKNVTEIVTSVWINSTDKSQSYETEHKHPATNNTDHSARASIRLSVEESVRYAVIAESISQYVLYCIPFHIPLHPPSMALDHLHTI